MKIAIVGAGPAGMYAADFLSKDASTCIDIYERLGEPFGLLRFGVAPDHAGTKAVARVFERTLARPNVSLRCNTEVGRDVTMDALLRGCDHLVLATGAGEGAWAQHRVRAPLEVTGLALLRWMNGHPEAELHVPGRLQRVLVIGHGNVSLDVVRLLARQDLDQLIPAVPAPVAAWHRSLDIRDIRVCGRGHAGQTRFSPAGLLELAEIDGLGLVVQPSDVAELPEVRNAEALAVLRDWAGRDTGGDRVVQFGFSGEGLVASAFGPDLIVHCVGQTVADVGGRAPAAWAHEQAASPEPGLACVHAIGWASGKAAGALGDSRAQARQLVEKIHRGRAA